MAVPGVPAEAAVRKQVGAFRQRGACDHARPRVHVRHAHSCTRVHGYPCCMNCRAVCGSARICIVYTLLLQTTASTGWKPLFETPDDPDSRGGLGTQFEWFAFQVSRLILYRRRASSHCDKLRHWHTLCSMQVLHRPSCHASCHVALCLWPHAVVVALAGHVLRFRHHCRESQHGVTV